ncbi:aspartic peptidase domain-containing protein [Mycena rebaudengoi]|nr:aspartic peptidase domain-containing protein [Mycena rebaudengoi]
MCQPGLRPRGVMTIGGRNQTLYVGAPEFGNVPENQLSWGLHLAAVAVQGKDISINATTTVRSTFTSTELTIRGPIPDVAAIWAAIPGSNAIPAGDRTGPGYYFPCNTTLTVSFSFGGQAWALDPRDLSQGIWPGAPGMCVGSIIGLDFPSWVFGIPFLASRFRNVYSVFRLKPQPAVGFALVNWSLERDPPKFVFFVCGMTSR